MNSTGTRYVSSNLAIRGSLIDVSYSYLKNAHMASQGDIGRLSFEPSTGKSVSWNEKVKDELRRRFKPGTCEKNLAFLAAHSCPFEVWRPLLLWHLCRRDLLLQDFFVTWLYPRFESGIVQLRAVDVWPYLLKLPSRGMLKQPWSEKMISRVASQLLHVAADFQILKGTLRREFTHYHLPDESFLYLLHAMSEQQPNAREVVHSTDWRMFLMDAADVERELFRLHQFRRVHYEVAGSLAQLKLPCDSAADYAREMVA